jgi:hypothetical protein
MLTANRKDSARTVLVSWVGWLLETDGLKLDVASFPNWARIEELRHTANAVKHAEGPSSRELRSRRPELFTRDQSMLWLKDLPVEQPLAGEDLWIKEKDFDSFGDAVEQFWEWLATELESKSWG